MILGNDGGVDVSYDGGAGIMHRTDTAMEPGIVTGSAACCLSHVAVVKDAMIT
jgi:hypothetical protein